MARRNSFAALHQAVEASLRRSKEIKMQNIQNQLLQEASLHEDIYDVQLVEKIGKDLHEVRFHLEELSRGDFIKLRKNSAFEGETWQVDSLTPRGHMVLRGQISLDDKARTGRNGTGQTHIENLAIHGGYNQVGGSQNTQNILNHSYSEVAELVSQLREIVNQSSLAQDDKEEVIEAIEKLPELAVKERSPEVLERVKRRLVLTNETLRPAKELYETAKPIMLTLYEFWKLHFPG